MSTISGESSRDATTNCRLSAETVKTAISEAIGGYGSNVPTEYLLMPVDAAGFEVAKLYDNGVSAAAIVHGVKMAAESYRASTGHDLSTRLAHMLSRTLVQYEL